MKKLLFSIALFASLSASAQKSEIKILRSEASQDVYFVNGNGEITKIYDPLFSDVKLERVNYLKEKFGTKSEVSSEVKFRNSKIQEYKKLGYTFDGMVTGSNGKFMKFVK